jgi:hypothetical protein
VGNISEEEKLSGTLEPFSSLRHLRRPDSIAIRDFERFEAKEPFESQWNSANFLTCRLPDSSLLIRPPDSSNRKGRFNMAPKKTRSKFGLKNLEVPWFIQFLVNLAISEPFHFKPL